MLSCKNITIRFMVLLAVLTLPAFALAAPPQTAPVTGIQPPVTSCPTGTAPLVNTPTTEEKFGTIKPDELSKLPLNERLRCDPTIKTMWKTMLNLADVLVALFFLAVAFATILHINYDTYGVKKALPPLLIGIVLAHFSLPIVYSIVDFAQIMSAGLFNSASSGRGAQGLADNIASAIFSGGLTKTGGGVTAVGFYSFLAMFTFLGIFSGGTLIPVLFIAAIAIGLIAIAIPSILILCLSFLLYARFYIILFLTIVAPLAWLTQAWGPVQGFFKKWWSQFTMWVFMAPVVMFFLWVAVAFSRASMNGGGANFGTYVITLVMFYLAITTPFTMGGQIMSSWGGLGKKASALGYKGVGGGLNMGMNKLAASKIPDRLTKSRIIGGKEVNPWAKLKGKHWGDAGFIGPATAWRGAQDVFKEKSDRLEMLGKSAARGMSVRPQNKKGSFMDDPRIQADTRNKVAEQTKNMGQEEKIEAIRSGAFNENMAKELIKLMATLGEDSERAVEAFKQGYRGKDLNADNNYRRQLDQALRRTNPVAIHNDAERREAISGMSERDKAENKLVGRSAVVDSTEAQRMATLLSSIDDGLDAAKVKSGAAVEYTGKAKVGEKEYKLTDSAQKAEFHAYVQKELAVQQGNASAGRSSVKTAIDLSGVASSPEEAGKLQLSQGHIEFLSSLSAASNRPLTERSNGQLRELVTHQQELIDSVKAQGHSGDAFGTLENVGTLG